jgi:L-amino acid N-acyltransferase YncA
MRWKLAALWNPCAGRLWHRVAVVIRAAQPGDAAAIAGIYAHYVATSGATFDEVAPTTEEIAAKAAAIQAAGLPFVVAEAEGAVAGYGYLAPYRERAAYRHTFEDSVYVSPDARGRGVGRALLERLVADAARSGAVRELIAVIADTGDPASVALHAACGFREAGRLRAVGCKDGRWYDTILMQRSV